MPVQDKFNEHEVVPDLIKDAPSQLLELKYGDVQVQLGNQLTPSQVKDQPTQINYSADPNGFYTLIFCDPDAPSRKEQTYREVQHWLVVNIPGNHVDKGEALSEYRGSGPPQGTGLHRYIFLVYKQPKGKIQDSQAFIDRYTREGRLKWSLSNFVAKHSLEGPIAGNFYQAEYDEYVATLQAQTKK